MDADADDVARGIDHKSRIPDRLAALTKSRDMTDKLMGKVGIILGMMQKEVNFAKALEVALRIEQRLRHIAQRIQRKVVQEYAAAAQRARTELQDLLDRAAQSQRSGE